MPFNREDEGVNQICMRSALLAHNLTRELQMIAHPTRQGTTAKHSPRWVFQNHRNDTLQVADSQSDD